MIIYRFFLSALLLFTVCISKQLWANDDKKLNVLFIMSDDMNNNLGCYGHYLVKTPNIDRLAKEGVLFTNNYCQLPLCGPSRASMLTGCYPTATNVFINETNFRDYLPNVVTLPQLFRNHGYYVARVGKIFHYGVPDDIGTDGLDDPISWTEKFNPIGRDKTEEHKVINLTKGKPLGSSLSFMIADGEDEDQTDGKVATETIRLIKENKDKAFFIAAGFFRPHCPYIAPKKYFELYDTAQIHVNYHEHDRDDIPAPALYATPKANYGLSVAEQKQVIRAYYASISFVDAQVGRILKALDEWGLRDNTIIVFTSDHGYHLGEHGLWHKFSLFEEANKVPMMIALPGLKKASSTCPDIVEMIDLYPTLAELCKLPVASPLDGKSFVPLLSNPELPWKKAALMMVARPNGNVDKLKPNWNMILAGKSVRTERWRYTEWWNGTKGIELYDHENDPFEITNLAAKAAYKDTILQLSKCLDRLK